MPPERHAQPKNKLQEWFPNTKLPVIISAPMKGVANGTLAGQVSKAGGFGTSGLISISRTHFFIFLFAQVSSILMIPPISIRLHTSGPRSQPRVQ